MKKAMKHTRVTVKLRKSEFRDEWYLYLEMYPVFDKMTGKPHREREYLNRLITTPIWDKTRNARTAADGTVTYKPKRDANGIIQCKADADRDSCTYADKVREIRQREYDNADLYTEAESQLADIAEKSKCDFIAYFKEETIKRHGNSSNSIIVNWKRVGELLLIFSENKPILFSNISLKLIEDFKRFLLKAPCGGKKSGTVSQNTACTYFSIFKAGLKQAFIDGYLTVDLAAKVKGIPEQKVHRNFLSADELNTLIATPCDRPLLKRAVLFSALTSLRHCDIQKLKWSELVLDDGHPKLVFTQKKTKEPEYNPIPGQAYLLCGEPRDPDQLVFEDLPDPSWISKPLKRWIESAGIKRNITFHCFRHTYATLQLANGTDIYTVSKMMGHTNVKTTQIYAKVVDATKDKATEAIQLNFDNLTL